MGGSMVQLFEGPVQACFSEMRSERKVSHVRIEPSYPQWQMGGRLKVSRVVQIAGPEVALSWPGRLPGPLASSEETGGLRGLAAF